MNKKRPSITSRARSYGTRSGSGMLERRDLTKGYEAGYNAAVRDLREALKHSGLSKVLDLAYGPSVAIDPSMIGAGR